MPRIQPNRIGYSGFSCVGIPERLPEPIGCDSCAHCGADNSYCRLPFDCQGAENEVPFHQDMLDLYNDPRIQAMKELCEDSFDPFEPDGIFIDILGILLDHPLLAPLITNDCYKIGECEQYSQGYKQPFVMPLFPYAKPATEPEGGASSSSSISCSESSYVFSWSKQSYSSDRYGCPWGGDPASVEWYEDVRDEQTQWARLQRVTAYIVPPPEDEVVPGVDDQWCTLCKETMRNWLTETFGPTENWDNLCRQTGIQGAVLSTIACSYEDGEHPPEDENVLCWLCCSHPAQKLIHDVEHLL